MRALAFEHLRTDPIGVFGDVLAERGIGVDRVLLYDGDAVPDWRRYDLVVAMGAGVSVWEEDDFPWIVDEKRAVREAVLAGVPYFGVCFGVQLLADVFGGRSFRGPEPEIGVNQVFLTAAARHDPVFRGFPADLEVCEWHSNHFSLPRGAIRLARSPRYENQAIRYGRTAYGIQCHLEPSLDDIREWLVEFPESADILEERHGPGSVARLLADYADFVPILQETGRQVFGRWLENALAYGGLGESARSIRQAAADGARPTPLIGRDTERARVEAALSAARRGESALLVVRGEAGMGKTSLLDATAASARGLRVLRASGENAKDSDRPFAGLAELLSPLSDALGRLSPSRSGAAATILGREAHSLAHDRFGLYAGAFDLLVASAAGSPLLLLVDDFHLLDEASSEALAFIARHLGSDGIALVVASESDGDWVGAEELHLAGLVGPDARVLLEASTGGDLTAPVADLIVELCGGNPLALLELPIDLTPQQRRGATDIDQAAGTTAEWAYLRRVAALPGPARQALLIAALADSPEWGTVVSALHVLGHDETSLDAALESGLIRADNGRCIFRHPLARVTAAYAALRADRTAAHAAIAEVSAGEARTWHRARAAQRPDESIAADLERVAAKARNGGAFAAAARAFEFAARLTPEPEMRAGRLLEAGRAARSAGNVHAALDHVDAALRAGPRDPTRREAEHVRGLIIARSGSAEIARDQLIALGARLERDTPEIAGETLTDAVLPALRAGGPAEAVRIGRRSMRLTSVAGGDAAVSSQIALGIALIYAGDYLAGASLVENAGEFAVVADPRRRVYLGLGLLLADRYEPARRVLTQLADEARTDGAVSALPYTLIRLADVELETGAWSAAAAALHEARRLASETGQAADHGLALGSLAWLEAATGNYEDCRAHLDDARALAERLGGGSRFHRAAVALGLLELGRGAVEAAAGQLEEICRQQDADGWSDAAATPHCRPDLVEAYAIAGREQEARAELELFRVDAERTQRPSALAAVLRCEGLLAEEPDLDRFFSAALGHAGMGPFDRARTELRYGERLLAAGREDEAKVPLGSAVDGFDRLGAEPWAARARAAAVAAGGDPPPAQLRIIDRLSPLELEIAVAAAEGAVPADIAERLILGVRTVELQLASAMIKLGLKSPAELSELVRSDTAQAHAVPQPI